MKFLKDISVVEKRVLLRCDFNVPINNEGEILDDFRIVQALPTIKYLTEQKAKVILMSHLGDPNGEVVENLRLNKVAEKLAEHLNTTIEKEDDCVGPGIEAESEKLEPGKILLLENLRFHKEETYSTGSGQANLEFAKKLSFLGDIYVNEAFSVCHRSHASISGVPQLIQHCAGFLLEKEINNLNKILNNPAKPMVVIVGGKKVETKSKFIDNISEIADLVIISGLIAKEIKDKDIKLKYPEKIVSPLGQLDALDINDETIKMFQEKIMGAKTILWNGPFGKFEDKKYEKGTLAIAKAVAESGAFSVVGGGETVEFLQKQGMIEKFGHVSTGGGAMLSYLAGDELPGLRALE